jgi:hypothetical protein
MVPKSDCTVAPMVSIEVIATTEISDAIAAYSMVVAPAVLRRILGIRFIARSHFQSGAGLRRDDIPPLWSNSGCAGMEQLNRED